MDDADDAIDDSFVRRPSSFLVVARARRALQSVQVGSARLGSASKVPLGSAPLNPNSYCIHIHKNTRDPTLTVHNSIMTEGLININFSKSENLPPGDDRSICARFFFLVFVCVPGRRRRDGGSDGSDGRRHRVPGCWVCRGSSVRRETGFEI